ncbi:ROK family protein [Kipferlia bialata]|uniref:ROK family protein n=1 Tax=Kipferlia bialata TaxID=797122 RepID=A0A9K3CQH9_9EUKA|nr:ROK family protein [Kipferlia bialata]|eukprot:g1807.t1
MRRPLGIRHDITHQCLTSLCVPSGLPQYIQHLLPKYPDHPLNNSTLPPKEQAFSLRGLAQKGDAMATEIFDLQAKALGVHVANLAMALDPAYFVLGGGLMDPESTSDEFRARYLDNIKAAAEPYLFPKQRECMEIVPATLGELSQAIGAALVAMYSEQ